MAYAALPWVLAAIGRLSGEMPFPVTRPDAPAAASSAWASWWRWRPRRCRRFCTWSRSSGARPAGRLGPRRAGSEPGVRMFVSPSGATLVAVVLLIPWSAAVLASRVATLGVDAGAAGRLGFGQVLRFDTGPIGHRGRSAGPSWWRRRFPSVHRARLAAGVGHPACGWWRSPSSGSPGPADEVGSRPCPSRWAWRPPRPPWRGRWPWARWPSSWTCPDTSSDGASWPPPLAGLALAVGRHPDAHRLRAGSLAPAERRRHLGAGLSARTVRAATIGSSGSARPTPCRWPARSLDSGIGFGTSYNGEPDVADQWITGPAGCHAGAGGRPAPGAEPLDHQVRPSAGSDGGSLRGGAQPQRPGRQRRRSGRHPGTLLAGLLLQTDLQVVNVDPNYTVYQNAAWAPARTVLPPAAVPPAAGGAAGDPRPAADRSHRGSPGAHRRDPDAGSRHRAAGRQRVRGRRPARAAGGCTSAAPRSSPQPAFGWAMSFAVPAPAVPGPATLRSRRPPWPGLRAGQIVEILLWVAAIAVAAIDLRRRRAEHPPDRNGAPGVVRPDEPGRRPRRGGAGAPRAGWAPKTSRARRCGSMSETPPGSRTDPAAAIGPGGAARGPDRAVAGRRPRPRWPHRPGAGLDPTSRPRRPVAAGPGGGPGAGPLLVVVLRRGDRQPQRAATRPSDPASRGGRDRQQRLGTRDRGRHPGPSRGAPVGSR